MTADGATRSSGHRVVVTWGFPGWLVWLVVHLVFLTGFKNRAAALFSCVISFFGRSRYERTIALQQVLARQATETARSTDSG
jgi:NADH dehydrogenase